MGDLLKINWRKEVNSCSYSNPNQIQISLLLSPGSCPLDSLGEGKKTKKKQYYIDLSD